MPGLLGGLQDIISIVHRLQAETNLPSCINWVMLHWNEVGLSARHLLQEHLLQEVLYSRVGHSDIWSDLYLLVADSVDRALRVTLRL